VHIGRYLHELVDGHTRLAAAFRDVASGHVDEPDVNSLCTRLAEDSDRQVAQLQPFIDRFGAPARDATRASPWQHEPVDALQLVEDLRELWVRASAVAIVATIVGQAAQALRDGDLLDAATASRDATDVQLAWLTSRIKEATPQAVVVG
jgi:hypothetical protein